jgi:hypothetical protein
MSTNDPYLKKLEAIRDDIRNVRPRDARASLLDLIAKWPDDKVVMYQSDVRNVLDENNFRRSGKKARKEILQELDRRIKEIEHGPQQAPVDEQSETLSAIEALAKAEDELLGIEQILHWVSDNRLFQWQEYGHRGFYERLRTLAELKLDPSPETVTRLRTLLAEHSYEILRKGAEHRVRQGDRTPQALMKARGGVRELTSLIITFQAEATRQTESPLAVQRLASACIAGIFDGVLSIDFSEQLVRVVGQDILDPTDINVWGPALCYLQPDDFQSIAEKLSAANSRFETSLLPIATIVEALGRAVIQIPGYVLVTTEVAIERLTRDIWSLTFYVRAPQASSRDAFLLRAFVSPFQSGDSQLEVSSEFVREAARTSNVALVVASTNPETYQAIRERRSGYEGIVDPSRDRLSTVAATEILEKYVERLTLVAAGEAPLDINYADAFPLTQEPQLRTHNYLVRRVNVLDRTRNLGRGAYLWCSLRRSGKSTAIYYMMREEGHVSWQTWRPEALGGDQAGRLNQNLEQAIKLGSVPADFLTSVFESPRPGQDEEGPTILVVDEYERLFQRLASISSDQALRHNVARPILDQLLEFSQSNILIFVGLRPNAHSILMDQNHLAAHVDVAPFPLFEFDSNGASSEFAELVERVLTTRVIVDSTFLAAVHSETAGHPYLTVEILRHFLDFQIRNKRPQNRLSFSRDDFDEFRADRFTPAKLAREPTLYSFHRDALRDALRQQVVDDDNRWIYFASHVLRLIARETFSTWEPEALCLRIDDLEELVDTEFPEIDNSYGFSHLLREMSLANFVNYDDDRVWPTVPLFARLSVSRSGRGPRDGA